MSTSPASSVSKSRSVSPSPKVDSKSPETVDKAETAEAEASTSSKVDGAPVKNGDDTPSTATMTAPDTHDWQAIYSPQHNAYYFYNARTNETTWQNPLQPTDATSQASASSSNPSASPEPQAGSSTSSGPGASPAVAQLYAMQAAAQAQGIDPSLAYLDPSLAHATGAGSGPAPFEFTAKFNSRTGAFTKADARDPGHLSEYERMKRMSEVYFDTAEWERQVALQKEEEEREGKKRKKPTKKDLDRWKEQKRLKKIAKTAWLRT
ncbi:hypothetical protein NEOLEDRAFT_1132556 [Neolentinus lepideus HHB14362 ss-1]|uniref:WW domain-containing protein n=1 Tax=Neolentinus lepideus HHB14362 ss-1 TaxID=1314782 RepID=A0A165T2M8_9AGAM|nr:hypothetical protein NEOLEDRAFT_1132556 [Neolentinus lepideus HHB14362 ss-1]